MKDFCSIGKCIIVIMLLFISSMFCLTNVYGKEKKEQVTGKLYEFGDKSKYEISNSKVSKSVDPLGSFSISGDFKIIESDDTPRYDVRKDQLKVFYSVDKKILEREMDQWHLCDDDEKVVDGIKLENKIKKGVMIIQTSLDGTKWITDSIETDVFTSKYDSSKKLYETKDIQLVNGCYYRVIIAYQLEIVNGTKKIGVIKKDDKEHKKYAETYEFYAVNSEEQKLGNPTSTPRKELGEKIGVKKDTGYSEEIKIDTKNPHYGWDIGTFFVNGYTRETTFEGKTMFLKNVGDKVTLWFNLEKDIEDLDGSGKYLIVEDKNGSDQYFQVKKTNFKHGALIIRVKDHEGKKDPVIFTDFLAANATTGADTRAVLFEEGDYEVALDYSIGESGILHSENDYRIFFEFSIRNGNTMFFPFDISTGAELRDRAVAAEGFTIDMAKSRYLDINVTRTAIVKGSAGHTEDVRFNGPAKDGDKYTEEGVYTVNVANRYTNEHTVKTFYVGTDPFIRALSKSGKTVKELDELISRGYVIEDDGTLTAPKR